MPLIPSIGSKKKMEATKIELSNVESTKMEMVAFSQQKEDNWLESLWDHSSCSSVLGPGNNWFYKIEIMIKRSELTWIASELTWVASQFLALLIKVDLQHALGDLTEIRLSIRRENGHLLWRTYSDIQEFWMF